mmetsp:Transcript_22443/g.75782  ORF Transcript_22443/g.75782 Transcript_22443/m.75782 type:complete len:205 (-) Transcript_22443:721-1335(-)
MLAVMPLPLRLPLPPKPAASASACSVAEHACPESERMRANVRQRPSEVIRAAYHFESVAALTPAPPAPSKPAAASAAAKRSRETLVGGPKACSASPHDSQLWPPTMVGTRLHPPRRISRSGKLGRPLPSRRDGAKRSRLENSYSRSSGVACRHSRSARLAQPSRRASVSELLSTRLETIQSSSVRTASPIHPWCPPGLSSAAAE